MTRKQLVEKLDTLVSIYIRKRDRRCVVCGSTENLTNGHIFSRTHFTTRWHIGKAGNCHTQCWSCNFKHTHDTVPYFNWYINKFGKAKFDALYREWNQGSRVSDKQMKEMIEVVKERLSELE
ncbi:MAG: recombination protein NinG [Blastocatellales bacterium]